MRRFRVFVGGGGGAVLFLGGRIGKTGKLAKRSRYAIVLLFSTYQYVATYY